jgi:hypothetical protein
MVIYRSADGKAAFQQVDDLHAAVAFVEKIRNEAGVENSRIYRMELVNYRFEPYYQVRLDTGELLVGPPGRVAAPAPPGSGPVGGSPGSTPGLGGQAAPSGAGAASGPGAPGTPTSMGLSGAGPADPPAVGTPGSAGGGESGTAGAGSVPPGGGATTSSPQPTSPASTAVDTGDERPGVGGRRDEGQGGNGARRGLFGR